ncbi:MAG: RHS repeat-associated core domain-containing protein, partial [Clostridia bacterium]|nr:RHS repeat-associated core domain-containing protein [Clostridia bacterium]
LIYLYDESGSPIGMQYRKSSYAANVFDTFYFEKNLHGDIVAIYTESGRKILEYTYDAWGNHSVTWTYLVMETLPAVFNPFRYRGYYYDTDTGLYYLQSRYYNPAWGRFLNADGYVNANGDLIGFNMYAYCSNNPVIYMDESGESVTVICLFLLGTAIAGGILGAVYTCNEANKNNEEVKPLEMIKNITFGFGAGLAVGGAIVSMGAVFAGLGAAATAGTMTAGLKAVFWGVTVKQALGIGALAIHAFTDVILPLFGGAMDAPEYEPIPQPQQPSPYIPYTHPAYY